MGKYWLHDCVGPLQTALGSKFEIYKGAETRSRSTGGFDKIMGLIMHHDADPPSGSDYRATDYLVVAPDAPIGNFHVHRDGKVIMIAAGASNHAGKGGPVTTAAGTVGKDLGNKYLIGIEASNSGVGETWPKAQLDSYCTLVATLCKVYKFIPDMDIYGHADWCEPSCPGRKIDPAGPTPSHPSFGGTSGRKTWDIRAVRKYIQSIIKTTPTTPAANDWIALGASYPTPPATLKFEDIHPNVPWLQAVLCSMKTTDGRGQIFNPAWVGVDTINGVQKTNLYGDATRNSVSYFQTSRGLTVDGVYGTVTASEVAKVRGK